LRRRGTSPAVRKYTPLTLTAVNRSGLTNQPSSGHFNVKTCAQESPCKETFHTTYLGSSRPSHRCNQHSCG
jgi:hypothetical protein